MLLDEFLLLLSSIALYEYTTVGFIHPVCDGQLNCFQFGVLSHKGIIHIYE